MILAMCLSLSTASQAAEAFTDMNCVLGLPVPALGVRFGNDNYAMELKTICFFVHTASLYKTFDVGKGRNTGVNIKIGGMLVVLSKDLLGSSQDSAFQPWPVLELEFMSKEYPHISFPVGLTTGLVGIRYNSRAH